ncbi:hypothetical protein KP509_01G013900 [Ceratopteris richardii]|nr:hypothetical protein KP509_01G013900 [Ceratopteris richardii]
MPPRGWNSYDSYSWIISEEQFLQNAKLVSEKLLPFGYEYVVLDFLWYRKVESGASVLAAGFDNIDEWGRPIPDPMRWPSSIDGQGLKPVADQVHALGLKFGIHVMRGISTQAVNVNTVVLGNLSRTWRARDIALQDEVCSWMPQCFARVDESAEGGKAFIQSLYDQYVSWGVDFVKHDCVFGSQDLSVEEVKTVSEAIVATGRPILYSISPGVKANPHMARLVSGFVNMYRITGDDWDRWDHLQSHFDVARDFAAAGLIGAPGLLGLSWPDMDMLPFGFLTDPGANHGPYRFSKLTLEEQKSQLTLWAMVRSPLFFGGDMINVDEQTIDLLTNEVVLDINGNSYLNMEVRNSKIEYDHMPSIGLHDCENVTITQWMLRNGSQSGNIPEICWTHEELVGGCFLWEPSVSTYTVEQENITLYGPGVNSGKVIVHENWPSCLDVQTKSLSTYSLCSAKMSQIWHLKPDRKLMSSETKLCAVVNELGKTRKRTAVSNTRVWMARGIRGDYYIALFNLAEEYNNVSLSITGIIQAGFQRSDISKGSTPSEYWDTPSISYQCEAKEAWSKQEIGTIKDRLNATLAPHGCALFSLQCSFYSYPYYQSSLFSA